ncbi:Adenylation-domain containing protein [Tolypocladium capitatum]|uniref:Adenylation-domain containing protein n=1 Tax=Tolypocladium capitatum TaxID=45235 RepID=A0A2K3Q8D5_9HYPO|nr:Adenylation-domain containing protein [Tolypocladium capitatum]
MAFLHQGQVDDYQQAVLAGLKMSPFPALPTYMQRPVADRHVDRRLPELHSRPVDLPTSTIIHVALALVVSRMTGSKDVVFGITGPGRSASVGTDETGGSPIMAVPFRVKISSNDTVSNYLEPVQGQRMGMLPVHQTGLDRLSNLRSDRLKTCSYQTVLAIQPQENITGRQVLEKRNARGRQQRASRASSLQLRLTVDKVTDTATFDSNVIEEWEVQKLLEHHELIIQQFDGAVPDKTSIGVELLTPRDLSQIWEWNSTVPAPIERCVHDIIDERAEMQPNATAICAWDGELTYAHLLQLATRLSRYLIDLGVGPDVFVPLCFEKSKWTTVAILGVLKAGGAFVLLDPSLPEQRLQTVVRQVGATTILSSRSNQGLSSRMAQRVVVIDSEFFAKSDDHEQGYWRPRSLNPSSAIYAVFTSGSTGSPKGVVITHRNIASALHYQSKHLGFTSESRVFDFASYSFDVAISNSLAMLAVGGCLCVPCDRDRINNLAESISTLRANVLDLTPSVSRFLVPEDVPGVQTLILSGEKIHINDIKPWWGSKVKVMNVYGPAECTATSTINSTASSVEGATRIGKGMGQVTWIVDPEDHNHLLPAGCVGELLLEGPLVGRGYLNNPERTARTFIEDPAWLLRGAHCQPGRHGRLYKTGDLVRYDHDGGLIFIGRKDTQVKIHGQRVELGEVECHLQQYMPEARQLIAEVITPGMKSSNPVLAAFVQTNGNANASVDAVADILPISRDLKEMLARHLPSYMVPTVFFSMRDLPITASGKVDRKRLREIGGSFSVQQLTEAQTAKRGPRRQSMSRMERQMQKLWGQTLNIEPQAIGLDDNFFQLGGHSIAAMKIVDNARKAGVALAVADVFRHPTLADLARLGSRNGKPFGNDFELDHLIDPTLKAALLAEIDSLDIGISAGAVADILPLTYFQEDCLVDGMKYPRQFCNYFYLDPGVGLDIVRFQRSCSLTLEKHPILRACFLPLHGRFRQVVLHQLDHPFHIYDTNEDLDQALHDFCLKDIEQFSPTQPPAAFILFRHKVQGIRFVLRLQHAQFDGLSLATIFRSLLDTYNDRAYPGTPSLSTFLAYARHRRCESISYWKSLLRGSSITRTESKLLPKGIRCHSPKGIYVDADIPLPHLPGNITLASLIYAAWAVLLSRISGENDVVYACLVAGRNSAIEGVQDIVGPCVNIIPVRVTLSALQTPADLLLSVQEQFIAIGEADSLGFSDIVEHCTDWPPGSGFDSEIQHQNFHINPEFRFTEDMSTVQDFDNPYYMSPCLSVATRPKGNRLHVEVLSNTRIMTMGTANMVRDSLGGIIEKLTSCLDGSLQSCMDSVDFEL